MPVAASCKLAADVKILYPELVNLYGCTIGSGVFIGPFVEIQKNASVGDGSRVQSHTFVCEGVDIGRRCFVGHGVMFINDRLPRAARPDGTPQSEEDWTLERTVVRRGASIGSNATILCGLEIGERALVGAGSVVTKSVPAGAVVAGNPARVIRREP